MTEAPGGKASGRAHSPPATRKEKQSRVLKYFLDTI
jgi:hypothetical protein